MVAKEAPSNLFIALFDYEPSVLCHTGHPEAELEFSEGDIIQVLSGLDADGFYKATVNGQVGLVPANFVEPITIEDSSARSRLYNQKLGPVRPISRNMISPLSLVEDIVEEGEEGQSLIQATSPAGTSSKWPKDKPNPPSHVKVEKALPSGILLSWKPPKVPPDGESNGLAVTGYVVMVNEKAKTLVSGYHKTSVSY